MSPPKVGVINCHAVAEGKQVKPSRRQVELTEGFGVNNSDNNDDNDALYKFICFIQWFHSRIRKALTP